MVLKAKKGMWFTQAKKDVKFRMFFKIVPTLKGKESDWVEWSDKQKKEYFNSKNK